MAKGIQLSWNGTTIDGLRILDLRTNKRFNTPQNPLEDGTPVIDHKVRLPEEVTLVCCIPNGKDVANVFKTLAEMRDGPLDGASFAEIIDKLGDKHKNLVVIDFGHPENTTDKFDNYYFDIKFKEIIVALQASKEVYAGTPWQSSTMNMV